MCGIVAAYAPHGGLGATELDGPLAALRHRGPDGHGTWCAPDGRAALGHTRLAVIDPATGHQPLAAAGLHLVVSGEFYGYQRIRRELAEAGARLRTGVDSEIALHLYARHGVDALVRLRGEFALVLWDSRRGELLAARDRFGIKPLYYTWHRGRLLLASEIKALLAAGVAARWDQDCFADHLQLGVAQDRTLFAGIHQLPPGCHLLAGPHGLRIGRYWDLDYPQAGEPPGFSSIGECVDAVGHAVAEAVTVRTTADVAVGCHLSGGLDSSSVLALAGGSGLNGARRTAFTVRFDDPDHDEGPLAAHTAAFLGAEHHEISCRDADHANHLAAALRAGETVQENSHGVARYLQSAAIHAAGFKVVLAGEGGDELFAGYPQSLADLRLTVSEAARDRAGVGYAKLAAAGMPAHLGTLLAALGFIPNWVLQRYLDVTLPVGPLLRGEFATRLAGRDASAQLLHAAGQQLDGRAFLHQSQYLFARSWLCNYILAAERLDMAHSVEVRLPLLDHRLFEVVRATPVPWYAHGGCAKYPLRAAMRSRLPAAVLDGPKRPFFAPPLVGSDRGLAALRSLAGGAALRDNPFFEPAQVRGLFDRLAATDPPRRRHSERLAQLVAGVCVLAEQYGLTA